uniref:(northern house mosquito) hypothetical protein n=2 Tax=Culex pipiens TaxID=7175 RepID=A0A8D8AHS8_CULPI
MSKDDAGKVVVKATWAKNLPVLDDASRFVEITLPGGNRKVTYKPIHIVQNPHLLDKIRSAQTVDIIVYKYSSNVSNNTVHKAVVAQLFDKPGGKDRAGAASNQRLCEIQERLEEIHAHKYDAQNIHFTLWAMAIEKTAPKNPVDFEQCLHNPPPADLLHFFPVRETNHERALMREYKLAQNVNNAYGNFIQLDKNSFDQTQAALRCLNDSFEQAKRNREMLEATYHTRASLIEASVVDLQEAKKETEEGKRLAKAVRTLKDFDHPDVHENERAKENTNRHRGSTRRTKGRRRERLRSV